MGHPNNKKQYAKDAKSNLTLAQVRPLTTVATGQFFKLHNLLNLKRPSF